MDSIYLVCRDAREDSLLGNIALGMEMKNAGEDVTVVFTAESLKALTGKEVRSWPPLLRNRLVQVAIAKAGTALGYDLTADFDKRWLETDKFIKSAVDNGLNMVACPIWTQLLGIGDELPEYLTRPDMAAYTKNLKEARQIIGGF